MNNLSKITATLSLNAQEQQTMPYFPFESNFPFPISFIIPSKLKQSSFYFHVSLFCVSQWKIWISNWKDKVMSYSTFQGSGQTFFSQNKNKIHSSYTSQSSNYIIYYTIFNKKIHLSLFQPANIIMFLSLFFRSIF